MTLNEQLQCLNDKQKQNSVLILSELFYLLTPRLKKIEVYDPYLRKNIFTYYLCLDDCKFPINQEDFEILRCLGLDVIIV